jgi:hypothetical protein
LDPTFGSGGISTFPSWYGVNAATVDQSGRIVLGAVGATAIRLNPNGSADQSFGNGGTVTISVGSNDAANGVSIDSGTGDVVLSGVAGIGGRPVLSVIKLAG